MLSAVTARLLRLLRPLMAVSMVVATVVVLTAGPAGACSCTRVEPQWELDHSDAVFLGTVTGQKAGSNDTKKLSFTVTRVFKGVVHEHQTVVTPSDSGACGLELPSNTSFLIAGRLDDAMLHGGHLGDGELGASLCDGVIGEGANAVPASFGTGTPPVPGASSTSHDFANADRIGVIAGFAALLAIARWRRPRRETGADD